MKAVIVELKEHDAAALTDEGCILKVKNKKYVVGQVIELRTSLRSKKFTAWAAAAAAVVVLLGAGTWAYYTPYSYVSLDVNPSIEYSVNRFDRVLSAAAVNNDGEEILKDLDLTNKPIEDAVKETVDKISKNGYFEGDDPGGIVISTSSPNDTNSQQLAKNLQTTAKMETKGTPAPVKVEAVSVGLARVQEARTLGTTPGRLNLVQKLQESSETPDDVKVEDWLHKPVKDIMKAIQQNRKVGRTPETRNTHSRNPSSSQSGQSSQPSASSQPDTSSQAESSPTESWAAFDTAKFKHDPVKRNGREESSSAPVYSRGKKNSSSSSKRPESQKQRGKPSTSSKPQSEKSRDSVRISK